MNILLNDKVKFLDEEGGGVVTKIIDHAMVEVTTPDGFSFPYPVRNLVKPQEDSNSKKLFSKDLSNYDNIPKAKEVTKISSVENETPLQIDKFSLKPEHFAAYLAFSPREQYRLVFGSIDVFLINVSSFTSFFVIYHESEKGFKILYQGRVSPFSKIHLAEIERDDLGFWEKTIVQMLVLEDNSPKLRGPIDTKLKIRGNRFFSENSYIQTDFLREKSIVFEIVKLDSIPVLHELNQLVDLGSDIVIGKTNGQLKKNLAILEHQTNKGQAVVDMHIWKLTDDELSMTAHEKFMTQMDYFKVCLDSALENNFDKVVFIHGVGTGRLKEEIQIYLDDREIEHKAAKMAEYGIGAIEVKIRR